MSSTTPSNAITLTPIGTYAAGVFDESAAEIVAHDPASQRLFVTNGNSGTLDVLTVADPTTPALVQSIDIAADVTGSYLSINDVLIPGSAGGLPGAEAFDFTFGGINSVAAADGIIAAAVENAAGDEAGVVAFYTADGRFLGAV